MKNTISKEDLIKKLEFIKKIIQNIDLNSKISFINLEAFYSYLKIYFNLDINSLMKDIEPFIPLNSKLINLLIFSLNSNLSIKQIKSLKKYIYDEARISFLSLIKNCSNNYDWEKIIFACENIRKSYSS